MSNTSETHGTMDLSGLSELKVALIQSVVAQSEYARGLITYRTVATDRTSLVSSVVNMKDRELQSIMCHLHADKSIDGVNLYIDSGYGHYVRTWSKCCPDGTEYRQIYEDLDDCHETDMWIMRRPDGVQVMHRSDGPALTICRMEGEDNMMCRIEYYYVNGVMTEYRKYEGTDLCGKGGVLVSRAPPEDHGDLESYMTVPVFSQG